MGVGVMCDNVDVGVGSNTGANTSISANAGANATSSSVMWNRMCNVR